MPHSDDDQKHPCQLLILILPFVDVDHHADNDEGNYCYDMK